MKKRALAFTIKSDRLLSVLTSEVFISSVISGENRGYLTERYLAIWDTGATGSVITKKVAEKLNLLPIDIVQVNTVGGVRTANVFLIGVILPNRLLVEPIRACEGVIAGADLSIGMDIITLGDFAVTNKNNKTTFSFRFPSLEEIDFLKNASEYDKLENQTI